MVKELEPEVFQIETDTTIAREEAKHLSNGVAKPVIGRYVTFDLSNLVLPKHLLTVRYHSSTALPHHSLKTTFEKLRCLIVEKLSEISWL